MNFEWTCQRLGCKKFIGTYTEEGLRVLSEEHMAQHQREDLERGAMSVAITKIIPRDYNILKVTPTDIGFLKTRGIKVDDSIELDLVSEYRSSKSELNQQLWAKILHSAWLLIPPGEKHDPRTK